MIIVMETIIIIMWQTLPGASPFPQCRATDLGRTLCAGPTTAQDAVV